MIRILTFLVGSLVIVSGVSGQTAVKYDLAELISQKKLETHNRELTVFSEDKFKGIHLSAKGNDGVTWITGLELKNGIIELDLRGKDVLQQSFLGIAFHGVDEKTLDAVYFRPFNFLATDAERKIHAVQYVSHPDAPWSTLRERHNGKYEKAVKPAPNPNEWFHVKIVLQYPQVKVYVNNNTSPCLVVEQLNDRRTGKLGFWVGNNSDGNFANLVIRKTD